MADLTSSLRQMRGPYLTDDTAPETPIQPGVGAFQAGVQSALTGISAGATAREAFAAEQAGSSNVSALRARAGQLALESEQQAPRVRSYKDINGVGDVAEYLAGGLGGAAAYIPPVVAGAAAARVVGPSALRALTPTAGSIAAMYPLEKGAAYLSQYEDPVQAAAPIEQRESVATKQAAIKAALLGGAGSSVLRGVMGRAREGIIGGALEAGIPMVGAEAVGQHYAGQLNPQRDTSHDTTALIDAALQGGALGAAGHVPSKFGGAISDAANAAFERARPVRKEPAAPAEVGPPAEPLIPENLGQSLKQAAGAVNDRIIQPGLTKAEELVRDAKPKASEFVKDAETYANEKVDRFTEATREAKDFPDFMRRVFGRAEDEAQTLADGDKAEAYKGPDGKVDEEKLFASDEPRKAKAAEYAQMLLDDPATPDHVRQKVESFGGDFSDPAAQSYIGNTILGQRAGQRTADVVNALRSSVNDLVKKAKDAVPEMKKAAGEAIDNAKDAVIKKNMQEPKTKLEVESLIHKGLRDELQAQPAAIAQVPELAKIITKLLSQGAPIDDTALKTFGGFHALDNLFKDSSGTLESIAKTLGSDDLFKRSAKFRSAEEDSKKSDSMLYRAIPPEHREQMKGSNFRELGRFIDSIASLSDDKFKLAVDGLATHVFGSREAARTVVDYYTRKNESELSDTPLKSIEHPLERDAQGIADTNPDKSFIYSSVDYDKAQPFHTSEVGRKGGLDEQLKAEQARGLAKVSKRNMVEHTRAEGIDPVDEIARVQHMIERRIEGHMKDKEYTRGTPEQKEYRQKQIDALKAQLDQIESRKREVLDDEMFKDNPEHGAEFAAENALQDFHVGVLERADADKFAADDRFMRSAKLAYSRQDAASREANKDKTVTFNMKDGKQLTLYAPAMVKLMGEKQGMGSEEHLGPRSDRLFRDAITSMLLNDKVASVAHGIRDVRYNDSATLRKTKEEQIRVTKEVLKANERFNEALSEREKNFEEMGGLISMIKAGEAGEQTFTRLKELQARNSDLKDAMDKARQDGADIKLEKTDKQEREEQGVTDIVKDIVEKEGATRINQERGKRKENDVRTTSSGVSAEQTPHDIKKQIFDLRKKLEDPGTPADKKRLRDKIATLQQELRKASREPTQLDAAIAAAQDRITKLNEYLKRAASPAERAEMRAEIEAKKAEIKKLEGMDPAEYAKSLKTEAKGEPSFDEMFDKALRVKDAETKGAEIPGEIVRKKSKMSTEIHEDLGKEGIAATHDSPFKFDKFAWREHKYKGEGVMVFGAGTYFSTKDGVHRSYKERFTKMLRERSDPYARERATVNGKLDLLDDEKVQYQKMANVANWEKDVDIHEYYKRMEQLDDEVFAGENKPVRSPEIKTTHMFEYSDPLNRGEIPYFIEELRDGKFRIDEQTKFDGDGFPLLDEPPEKKVFASLKEAADYLSKREGKGVFDEYDKLLKELNAIPPVPNVESPTYHVSIRARPDEILNWNEALSKQPVARGIFARALKSDKSEKLEWGSYHNEHILLAKLGDAVRISVSRDPSTQRWILRSYYTKDGSSRPDRTYDLLSEARAAGEELYRKMNSVEGNLDNKTGAEAYKLLSTKLGGSEAASIYLADHGLVGHKFNASGGKEDRFPNYVVYNDDRIDVNYVHFSAQRPEIGKDISPEQAKQIQDYIMRTRGPEVRVELDKFAKDIGGSGEYFKQGEERVIKVARDALNPQSVAFHESMHDFFHTLLTDAPGNEARRRLLRAAERPWIQAQLKVLLKDHPEALEQIKKDPEESLSYMYQFWASGNLRMNMDAVPIFSRITKFIRDILGVVTRGEQAEAILQAFHDGKLADMSIAGQVIADMHMNTLGDKWESVAKPLRKVTGAWLTPSTDILRNTGTPSLKALADKFHMEPDRERGEAGFMQRRSQTEGKMYNQFQDVLDKTTEAERKAAIDELQSMLPPTTKIGMAIRDMLDGMYDYMSQAGVKNSVVENNKVIWKPVQRVADYFPRVWDRNVVRQREAEFKELLKTEGNMNDTEATAIVKTILQGDGLLDLAESERHIGFTPYSSAVKNRGLTFIKQQNAAKFAEFQNKDLVHVMQTYIRQAVHRGEYARYFGNDGEVIKQALEKAKLEGASEKEVLDAARAVRAMEGTLGAEINPRLRDVFNAAVGYENIVLLPFALFSSLIDPLGVAVRSGKTSDAAIAFKDGVKGIFQDAFRTKKDREYEMARTIGVISDLNKLEAMGQVTQSQYSGKWMRKFNDTFFKLNGMETWNERMRVSAMGAGMRFMVRNKDNARYMEELGIEKGDIKELPDGRIARTTDEGLTPEQEQRVQQALYRFVDGAILRPNAAHRPPWTSDPHYMLVSHLKQYTFSFQQTIMKQVKKEAQNGNYMPAFVLASYVPFMAASDLMRGSLAGTVKNGWTFSQFMADGIGRSGILGVGSFGYDAMKDASMGQMPGSSFLGPTAQHAIMAAKTIAGAPGSSWHELFWRSMPASPLSKAIE